MHLFNIWVRADLNAKLNTNFSGTWHWQERGGATLQVSHTSGDAFGKAAVSSFTTELKPNQTDTLYMYLSVCHIYTSPGEILNWWSQTGQNQKKRVEEAQCCLIFVLFLLLLFFLKSAH